MYKINGCNKLTCYWGQPWHKHIKEKCKSRPSTLDQKLLMLMLASLVKTITTLNMLMHARVTHWCINYHKYHKFFLHFSFLNASKTLNKLVLSILWNICQSSLLSRGCAGLLLFAKTRMYLVWNTVSPALFSLIYITRIFLVKIDGNVHACTQPTSTYKYGTRRRNKEKRKSLYLLTSL